MTRPLRILIACETSGIARRAFAARGHDAWSCDLLPAVDGSNRHIIGDARDVMQEPWDLLFVAHPPCTRLTNSGVRWITGTPPKGKTNAQIIAELDEGAALFSAVWNVAHIPRVAVENSIMHRYAKERIRNYRDPDQIVQPWWFGDPAFKATAFWLRGLPPLKPTNKLTPPAKGTEAHKAWSMIHRAPPGPERWKFRSKTFPGLADAVADQWGGWAIEAVQQEGTA